MFINLDRILLQYCSPYGQRMHFYHIHHLTLCKVRNVPILFLTGRAVLFLEDSIRLILNTQKIRCHNICICLFQQLHKRFQLFCIQPVVPIHHFKIFSCGITDPIIDARSMTTVFLIIKKICLWILFTIPLCNLCRMILGTIVDYQYFYSV